MNFDETRLFGIPVSKLWVPETEALKRQFLPEMLRRYEARHYARPAVWESDRVHTSFAADKADQVIEPLPPAYENLLRQFVKGSRYRLQLWHSVFWTGGEYEQRHHHIPSHLTVMHFLSFDRGQHAPPMFYDPGQMIKSYCSHDAVPPDFWSEGTEMDVHEGDALVFPSYLEHRVAAGQYRTPRVTVSMTVTLLSDG